MDWVQTKLGTNSSQIIPLLEANTAEAISTDLKMLGATSASTREQGDLLKSLEGGASMEF